MNVNIELWNGSLIDIERVWNIKDECISNRKYIGDKRENSGY